MKISELEGSLRDLALLRTKELRGNYNSDIDYIIGSAFDWASTPEGWDFWNDVNIGVITKLPNKKVFKLKLKSQ